jgi:hypothetical protein
MSVVFLNSEGAQKLFDNQKVVGLKCRVTDPGQGHVYLEVVEDSTGEKIGGCISSTGFTDTDPGDAETQRAFHEYKIHTDDVNERFGKIDPTVGRRVKN